ncbi:MAG: hypothetical protein IJR72_03690 [Oscillospiraceae bacterium]|nr:hypothetical protein [Oscillospiraceae bacterium]
MPETKTDAHDVRLSVGVKSLQDFLISIVWKFQADTNGHLRSKMRLKVAPLCSQNARLAAVLKKSYKNLTPTAHENN